MAFVTKNVIYSTGMENQVPSGHSQSSTATALTSVQIQESFSLTLPCSGAVAATAAAGFNALFVDIGTAIDTYITDTLGVDTSGNSVDYTCTVRSVNNAAFTDIYKNDANRNYTVLVNLQVRVY